MDKKYFIMLLVCGLVLIYGCAGQQEPTTKESPYIGGSKGIVAEFEPMGIEENGVNTIYNEDTFPIQVVLKNKGEEDIETGQAKVKIYGILLTDFSGISSGELLNQEKLEKISEINKEGGEQVINFGDNVKYLPQIQGDFIPLNIFAGYTYRYKTKVSVPNVCFKEDPRDTEVCNLDETKTSYSSGAPIQIISVTEKPAAAGKVSLSFEVENVGSGDSAIPGQEFNTRYNQVQYKIIPDTEASKWKCAAAGRENQARFTEDTATIICTLKDALAKGEKYTKEVVLEIEYDYRDVIQASLRVKKSS